MSRQLAARWYLLFSLLGTCAALLAAPLASHAQSAGGLFIQFLDVGQGDATLLVLPNGRTLLVNCGPPAQGKQLALKLEVAGVSQVDTLMTTSVRPDATGGCTDVLNYLSVGQVLSTGQRASNPSWTAFQAAVPAVSSSQTGQPLDLGGGAMGTIVYPAAGATSAADADGSLVLLVEYGGTRVLLCGPIRDDTQRATVLAGLRGLPINILQVPDHGAATSLSDDFVARLFPAGSPSDTRVAVLSYSARDPLQPDPAVVARLVNANAQLLSTASNGSILVSLSPDGGQPLIQTDR